MEIAYQKDKHGTFKIGVFGIANVGKSALITRFIFNTFRSEYIPTYEDIFKVSAKVDGYESDLELLDTPGTEEAFYNLFIKDNLGQNSSNVTRNRLLDLDAYFLVYDTTNLESFRALKPFHQLIMDT